MSRRLPLLLLLAALLSSCAGASPVPAATSPSTAAPTFTGTLLPSATFTRTLTPQPTLGIDPASLKGVTIEAWQAFTGPAYDLFNQQVARFDSSNQWGIVVNHRGFGDYASLFDAVSSSLSSGGSPDLVAALPEQALAWDASSAVVDLSPYLADPNLGLAQADLADIPAPFLAQDNRSGKVMGLPAQRSARFLFYNKTWARLLGFNSAPATAADFREQACAANTSFKQDSDPANDGYGGWVIDTDWQTAYSWLLAFDGSVTDGASYTFRTDPNLQSLKFLKQLYDDHCAWLSTGSAPFDSFARRSALFISADLASLPSVTAAMSAAGSTDEWELIPFPGTQRQDIVAYGPSYTVLKTTPEKQLAAWLFMRWLLSPGNQAKWVQSTGLLPLRTSSLSSLGDFRAANPQWDAAVKAIDVAQTIPQLASWRKVRYVLQDGLDMVYQSNLSPDQLPSILTEMDNLASEQNK